MPWKESSVMDERLRFISLLLEGEAMSDVCREFGVSRKTGYKIYDRYKQSGSEALTDRSRRPYRYANQLPPQLEAQIIGLKHDKPHWGARKIRELLLRRLASEVKVPARSTIHAVLDRHGLVRHMGRRRSKAHGTGLSAGTSPNDLWCADFKGEFTLGNRRYCYPLTVTDHASRYLLMCEALDSVREEGAFEAFEHLFHERGLPASIRSDNGVPFASPNALFNLSKLAVWWLRLGITIERIKPGKPQQNGRHERMHRTLKAETTRPPGQNSLQQQARFDDFLHEFNTERPHEAIAMKCPAEVYQPSLRPYQGLTDINYPFHDKNITVTACGRICMARARKSTSQRFSQAKPSASRKSTRVFGSSHFCTMISDISTWNKRPCNPSTIPSAQDCHPCLRYTVLPMSPVCTTEKLVGAAGFEPATPIPPE